VIEVGENAFLENTPTLVFCDFLEPGRLYFSERRSTGCSLREVFKLLPDFHESMAAGPA
jgi:hypothetical protein